MTKDTAESPERRLPWAGKQVDTANVEEELAYLWHLSADNVRMGQNVNVRTSVLNFVICTPDVDSARQASLLIRDLSSTHIARVILLILDRSSSAPSGVKTWVTLRSFPVISDIMRHSFEQVTAIISGSAIAYAANIMQPFLKPDLPVYLWWHYDPNDEGNSFSRLVNSSSRIVIDSNSFLTPTQSLCSLAEFLQQASRSAISDLSWGRITPWRQLVAQFFDVPEYKSYLSGVNSIEVEYAIPEQAEQTDENIPNPAMALLLASWLKTSLSWKITSDEAYRYDEGTETHTWRMARTTGSFRIASPSSQVKTARLGLGGEGFISIRPCVQSQVTPGSICLVRLVSMIDSQPAIFSIKRDNDADVVFTSTELVTGPSTQRTVSLPADRQESDLLHDELEIIGRDHLYEDTLRGVLELLS